MTKAEKKALASWRASARKRGGVVRKIKAGIEDISLMDRIDGMTVVVVDELLSAVALTPDYQKWISWKPRPPGRPLKVRAT